MMNKFESNEWQPEPKPDARFGPPGRKPPTAIATATPEPPQRPGRRGGYRRLSRRQRFLRTALQVAVIGSGTSAITWISPTIGVITMAGLAGIWAVIAYLSFLRSRMRRGYRTPYPGLRAG